MTKLYNVGKLETQIVTQYRNGRKYFYLNLHIPEEVRLALNIGEEKIEWIIDKSATNRGKNEGLFVTIGRFPPTPKP